MTSLLSYDALGSQDVFFASVFSLVRTKVGFIFAKVTLVGRLFLFESDNSQKLPNAVKDISMIFVKKRKKKFYFSMVDVAMTVKVAGLSEVTTSSTEEVLLIKIFHLIFIAKDEIILLFNHFSLSVRNDFPKQD